MTVRYDFEFEDYQDFDEFLKKHHSTINMMGEGDDLLTDQIRRQVNINKQLPEHFEFDNMQYLQMMREDKEGMKKLEEDNRVEVTKTDDEDNQNE